MNLTHIDLTSFRSYRGLTLDLEAPRVLIAGLNGTGKSSIRDGIRWCVLWHCQGTDAKGAGSDVLIPTGLKSAEVGVGIAGIGTVKRSYAAHGGGAFSVEGFTGTSSVQQQALLIKLNTMPAFLDAVLDTKVFLDLNHVEAKALVLSLLGVTIDVPDPHPTTTADGSPLHPMMIGSIRQSKSYTLDELDLHYKQAFEDRKVAKRTLQQFPMLVKPMASETIAALETKLGAALSPQGIALLDGQLGKLRDALGVQQQAAGTVIGRRQTLTGQIEALERQAPSAVPVDLTPQITALEAALEAQEEPVAETPPKPGDPARLVFLRKQADVIGRHVAEKGCVLDPRVQCLTPQKQFTMAQASLKKELEGLTHTEPPAPTESPRTALRRKLEDLQRQQQASEARIAQATADEARLTALRAERDGLQDTAAAEEAMAALQIRIAKGESLLAQARAHCQALEGHQKALEQSQKLTAEVERLEALVETLGPKGVRVQALGEAMGRFEAAVNPYLESFGWKIGFSVEPWQVSANGRPVETYSESEQFRIGVALQLGIAMISGLRFAVIDRLDQLDVANRGLVTKMLSSAPLDQILILSTREPSQPLPPVSKGLLAYRLGKDGDRTVIAERSGP